MRKSIKDFVAIAARCLPFAEPIYEFGALQVPGQERFADLRPLFPGRTYVGADMREGPGVDTVLDLHRIDLPSGSAGSVLCLDTLEHVEYPHRAMQEIHRVLAPDNGIVVISSVMDFPIHDFPHDYWRFTPAAFESLLKPFTHSFVGFAGSAAFPHTVVGIGLTGRVPDMTAFEQQYRRWQRAQRYALKNIVLQATPPALRPVLGRLYAGMRRLTNT